MSEVAAETSTSTQQAAIVSDANPVPLPRRSGNHPPVSLPGAAGAGKKFVVSSSLSKSPRRVAEGERFTFEETKILELFKKLSSAAQNKMLDAMEDWQDEVAEKEIIQRAEEEEKKIKEKKMEAIRIEEERYQQSRRSVDLRGDTIANAFSQMSREKDATGSQVAFLPMSREKETSVVQPAVEQMLREKEIAAEISRIKEEGGAEEKNEKPLLKKIATLTEQASSGKTSGASGAPIPAPRRDSRATPVQKPIPTNLSANVSTNVSANSAPAPAPAMEPEPVLKTRNPKLANMMAMMGVEESRGTLFADQTMTPEVSRHQKQTVMSQTAAEIDRREHAK